MPRYFVDERVGCIAVRDRTLTDPEYPGLHQDTEGVVWYAHGVRSDMGWDLKPEDIQEAHRKCAELNQQPAQPTDRAPGQTPDIWEGIRRNEAEALNMIQQLTADLAAERAKREESERELSFHWHQVGSPKAECKCAVCVGYFDSLGAAIQRAEQAEAKANGYRETVELCDAASGWEDAENTTLPEHIASTVKRMKQAEARLAEVHAEIESLADLLADSEDLHVKETPAVARLNAALKL